MPHIGSSLIDWLTADFEILGLAGQNWMLALSGGAAAIFFIVALVSRACDRPTRRIH
ncbi:MAG TPA: hypothetical protein VFX37_14955 [Pseudolabrys sp.]|nr:hypothetical protein [Pseudolabrys sp.]